MKEQGTGIKEQSSERLELRARTKRLALRVIRLYQSLPRSGATGPIASQVLRSGTSVGAQYREACRARSNAEFLSKIQSAMQELDETGYWLELLIDSGLVPRTKVGPLSGEADELLAILYSIQRKVKRSAR
ncbi:four helix bundle protein [candidate division KSB1 bacterium]|nr:four helix bundle protein [candidate division KSB1 bacterium]